MEKKAKECSSWDTGMRMTGFQVSLGGVRAGGGIAEFSVPGADLYTCGW